MNTPTRFAFWVVICFFAVCGAASASPSISEFPAGLKGAHPADIAAGADGALWFTLSGDTHDAIGRMAPDGSVTTFPAPADTDDDAHGITLGSDGNIWFGVKHRLVRVAADGSMTRFPVGSDSPRDLISGPGGDIWYTTNGDGSRRIGRMSMSGVVTDYSAGITSQPVDLAPGSDGNVWFAESGDKAGRITPDGQVTEFSLGGSTKPTGIAAGFDGSLWLTGTANDGVIVRIDVNTGAATRFDAGLPNDSEPQSIVAAFDGNMYFTDRDSGAIGQVEPDGTITEMPLASNDAKPLDITRAPDGRLWFTETNRTGDALGRITLDLPIKASLPLAGAKAPSDTAPALQPSPINPAAPSIPSPTLGQSIIALPTAGVVRVRMPGAARTTSLSGAAVIPFGAAIDTTHGQLIFASALPGGGTQLALLWNGRARLTQGRDGRVDVYVLRKTLHCGSHASSAAARKKTSPNMVWMRDKNGKFRSHGKNSVATVRGTVWATAETCGGTLTQVKEGTVAVRDNHRHRTVLVTAGHSYLAKSH